MKRLNKVNKIEYFVDLYNTDIEGTNDQLTSNDDDTDENDGEIDDNAISEVISDDSTENNIYSVMSKLADFVKSSKGCKYACKL